ncbi:hypothetical protein HK100_004428 [Physocladia obscura]|uniref:Dienelactone hydrolase domain-containing protein n=1 Tax=Physocladia obscura TaxID=109957 RepID=A0AAD5XGQ6_9FUNG|nr:hypothetical protein HK100_004428 [Physocladia obscura]
MESKAAELTADCCGLKASFNSEYAPSDQQRRLLRGTSAWRDEHEGGVVGVRHIWHARQHAAGDGLGGQALGCDRTGGMPAMMAFIDKHSYAAHVREDVRAVLAWLAADKHVTSVAVFGLCWGGRIAVNVGQEGGGDWALVKAVGSAHPSLLTADDGKTLAVPLCLLPSGAEDAAVMDAIFQAVKANASIADKSVHVRFNDMPHGFVGAGADFNDPAKLKAANDALNLAADFFKANL